MGTANRPTDARLPNPSSFASLASSKVIWESERIEDAYAEVEHVVRVCVHAVATRAFVESNQPLLSWSEERQLQAFEFEERSYQSEKARQQAALMGRPHLPKPREVSARPSHRRRSSEEEAPLPPPSLKALSRRSSRKPSFASSCLPEGLQFESHADSLLPMSPAKSQFAFEFENPLQMHSQSEVDRRLQRRLAMISQLQGETIKLEKLMRAERAKAAADGKEGVEANQGEASAGRSSCSGGGCRSGGGNDID
ncbi:MAG: hypothetical protein SGPRY_002323 [Prymnesium sp.]